MKVTLGDIAVLINGDRGRNYPSQSDIDPFGDVPFVNAGHLTGREISFDEMNYISQEKYEKLNSGKFVKGDILYCLRGSLGKKAVIKNDIYGAIASSLVIIRPNTAKVDVDYLMFALDSPIIQEQLKRANNGSSQPNLSAASVRAYDIDLPDKELQLEISERLSKVRSVIDARKEEIALLDDLIKARFVEMFGDPETNPMKWTKESLSSVITAANNGMARRGNDENGSIVMRLVELQDGYIDYSNPNRIRLTEAEKKRYLLNDKDFLFARVNGNPDNVGRCAVFYDIGEPVYHNDHIIRVHFDESRIDGPFASALLNSEYGKRQLRNQIKTSAGQYTVNQDGIGAIITILPPIELQEQFSAFVSQVDKSKVVVQKALDEAQLLFDSLMQKYFG